MPTNEWVLNSRTVSKSIMARVKERKANPADLYGLSWGFPTLDWLTGGIQNGLVVMGAETGAGKSLLGGQVAACVAEQLAEAGGEQVVKVVHCEMSAEDFQQRLISQIADVPERRIRSGRVSDEEYKRIYEASVHLSKLPFEYLEDPGSIEQTIDFITRGGNCGFFLVDHAQSHASDRQGMSPLDHRHIGELAVRLGNICKHMPGLLLSQVTNDVGRREDHRPTKADLYGAKGLQQPASLILMMYRPDVYQVPDEARALEPKTVHLYIEKNRWSSETGDAKLVLDPVKGKFHDVGFKSEAAQKLKAVA